MNWKVKAHAMALLSRAPGGKRLYHLLQRCLGSNALNTPEATRRAVEIVRLMAEAGKRPHGATFVEIGTGWRPFVPFILYLAGAERVITFDINPWLTGAYAFETYRA